MVFPGAYTNLDPGLRLGLGLSQGYIEDPTFFKSNQF